MKNFYNDFMLSYNYIAYKFTLFSKAEYKVFNIIALIESVVSWEYLS